mmetsp:Transcript_8778/g.14062  ORF Transcript_8778/g.14062 Transcript_8778/m.14062 type:complete len:428 (+) Transcript_8778:172-1455(+)
MCKTEETIRKDLPSPPSLRAASTISNQSDGSESDESGVTPSNNDRQPRYSQRQQSQQPQIFKASPSSTVSTATSTITNDDSWIVDTICEKGTFPSQSSTSITSTAKSLVVSVMSGMLNASFMILFSLYFPFMLAPYAATQTYHAASYTYDPELSHFDNSAWTWGTDYALAVVMAAIAYTIVGQSSSSRPNVTDKFCRRSSSLLILYGVSVIAGGLAHQFFTTLEDRNSTAFRCLWTVCVGTVCFGSVSMGMSGTEAFRKFQQYELQRQQREQPPSSTKGDVSRSLLLKIPLLSDAFWLAFGGTVTAVCMLGGISFQRPACDIFIAGITQSPSTFYCMIFFFLVQHPRVQTWAKVMGFMGFILNAPLLPMYPLLVQYTDWTLASVNTLLHCWLCVAWSMQGISMRHVIRALVADDDDTQQAAKKNKVA